MTAVALSALCLSATGCADKQSVLFVTATTIGIDADTTPPHATIGYDRYEGYIGPSYNTGALPPVFAKIQSDLKIFNPEIRQLYATGDAAKLVTKETIEPGDHTPDGKMLTGSGRFTLIGTGTNIGLRVTWAGNAPESISFGYKRKEFSYIPLGSAKDADGDLVDRYGSVLAAIDMGVHTESFTTAGMKVTQFFATGDAAKNLAVRQPIRERYVLEAASAVASRPIVLTKTESGNRLANRALVDDAFAQRLSQWMKDNHIDATTTEFLLGEQFETQRQKAVQELNP